MSLVWPPYLEPNESVDSARRSGTFVMVGTHTAPFDRMLGMVDRANAAGLLPHDPRAVRLQPPFAP